MYFREVYKRLSRVQRGLRKEDQLEGIKEFKSEKNNEMKFTLTRKHRVSFISWILLCILGWRLYKPDRSYLVGPDSSRNKVYNWPYYYYDYVTNKLL